VKSFFFYRSDWRTDDGPADVLIAFNAAYDLDSKQLREIVDKEVQRFLRPDQVIILSRSTTISAAALGLQDEQTKSTLLERVGEACQVELWAFDGDGNTSVKLVLQEGRHTAALNFGDILRRGITQIFNEHRGFVEGSENYHFRNPSGKHTDRFMRLSNILVRQAEITFLAASLLRFIPGNTINAYIDTPALYAVVSALNELRRGMPGFSHIAAENFRSYYGVAGYPFTERDQSVAIISASSSGSLQGKLVAESFPQKRIIHLLFLGDVKPELTIAVDLALNESINPHGHDPARRTYGDRCDLCTSGSMFIELRGDQFDISPPQPKPLVVRQKHASKTLGSQMERLIGARAITSSATAVHWIWPDALLAHELYRERLDYFLRRFVPAGAKFCVLADEQSVEWGNAAAERSGQEFTFVRADKANDIEANIKDAEGPILVIAAVIGSGRRLLDISRELRTAAPRAPITYIAGFAKSTSVEDRKTLKSSLTFSNREAHHAFEMVEEMVLPTSRRENAWENELTFLQTSAELWKGANLAFAKGRIATLQSAATPLRDELFVGTGPGASLKLRPGFAFWPGVEVDGTETQADVFATISSVLQSLRTAPASAQDEALRSGWFRQSLIHPEVFGRFNDGIIQGSFLRAALPSELDYRNEPELSEMMARLMGRIVEGAHLVRGEGAFEFLLALGGRRLRLKKEHFELAMPQAPPRRPLIQAMRKAVLDAVN
jgi:hypothetical protein